MNFGKKILAILILIAVLGTVHFFRREIQWWYKLTTSTGVPAAKAPAQKAPCPGCNLILISLDTVRADRMGFLGSGAGLTPNLDRIAARSLVFTNAFTNAFFTTPSHMTAFTSLYPTTHRVESTDVRISRVARSTLPAVPLDARFKTLAEKLQSSNYETVWSGPLNFKFLSFREGFGRGFDRALPPVFKRGLRFPPESPQDLDRNGLAKIFGVKKKPYFVFLHSYVTHLPYVVGPEASVQAEIPYRAEEILTGVRPILRRSPETLFQDAPKAGFKLSEAVAACQNLENMKACFERYVSQDLFVHRLGQWQLRRATKLIGGTGELQNYNFAYDYGVAAMDRQIGELWNYLEQSGALKNSVVVFFSDHGEELFEHGEGNHSSFYEHTARVPLVIHFPGQATGQISDRLVSLVDLMPSILDVLQIDIPAQAQGQSVFTPEKSPAYVFGSSLGVTYVRDQEWKLILAEQGKTELFNLLLDKSEKENLIDLRLKKIRAKTEELENALAGFRLMQAL